MAMSPADILADNPVVAAPMAGVTDKTFRLLAKEMGCGLVVTEMVSAKALVYNNLLTYKLVDISEEQPPISIQIFGSDAQAMAKAASIVQGLGAALVDINMGCPTPKIVKNGEGAALMRDPSLAGEIVIAVKKAVTIPVTVKIRAGWDDNSVNAPEFARVIANAGADMVAVHGRTRQQFYAGAANWDIIRQVKQSVSVPVVGNGDIWQPEDAQRMLTYTGCDGVMVGRGALGNPWLFKRIIKLITQGELLPPPSGPQRINMALRHLDMMVQYKGEGIAVREMRKHISWYIKGLHKATRVRELVNKQHDIVSLRNILRDYSNNPENLPNG